MKVDFNELVFNCPTGRLPIDGKTPQHVCRPQAAGSREEKTV
jgi:hypothetical protein